MGFRVESLLEEQDPGREALVDGERRCSYAELEAESNRLAHVLRGLGLKRGDRVAIHLPSSLEAVVALFATLKGGGCFVMLNPSTKPSKLTQLLDDARARILILGSQKLAAARRELELCPHLETAIAVGEEPEALSGKTVLGYTDALSAGPDFRPEPRGIDLDLAAVLYTSGSTGAPKGVMLTHRNVVSATRSIAEYLRLTSSDVIFSVLPLSFGYGLTQLFTAFSVGARLVLERSLAFPHLTLTRMRDERATGFAVVPTMAAILLQLDLPRYELPLRYLTCAGGALAPEQAERLRAALPRTQIIPMYGQTECLRILHLAPEELAARPGSVGRGMPNQELFLLGPEGREVGCDEVGELVVRGAHVMQGYWQLADETEKKLRPLPPAICAREQISEDEKLLYTGDLFRRDRDGYYYFVGRTDHIIKSRGEKVSPHEVEMALLALDGVTEAAVVGAPHPILGEAVKAIVVLAPGATITVEDVRLHCAARLEDHMVPQLVEFRSELPKNERGKILRQAL
jgi:amino acid adenylation domain-containing protein